MEKIKSIEETIAWKELRDYEIRFSVDQLSEDAIDSTSVSSNAQFVASLDS